MAALEQVLAIDRDRQGGGDSPCSGCCVTPPRPSGAEPRPFPRRSAASSKALGSCAASRRSVAARCPGTRTPLLGCPDPGSGRARLRRSTAHGNAGRVLACGGSFHPPGLPHGDGRADPPPRPSGALRPGGRRGTRSRPSRRRSSTARTTSSAGRRRRRVDDGAPRRGHRRPRRPRQVLADRATHRDGPGPMGRGEAPGAHDRPRLRVVRAPVRTREWASWTCRATNDSSRTCSPASDPFAWSCSWSPPTKDGVSSRRNISRSSRSSASRAASIALTKRDLVDDDGLDLAEEEVRDRIERHGPVGRSHRPRVSAATGRGSRRPPDGARRHAGARARSRGSTSSVVRRPRVHDRRSRHRRHGHARR